MKPANLLLHKCENTEAETLKIADFGVSQIMPVDKEGRFEKALMLDLSGTKNYLAPELKKSHTHVGPEIDMWAFGIILYQMCVAYLPVQANRNYSYASGEPIPFRARDWRHLTDKGAVVQDLIKKCLNIDPD